MSETEVNKEVDLEEQTNAANKDAALLKLLTFKTTLKIWVRQ